VFHIHPAIADCVKDDHCAFQIFRSFKYNESTDFTPTAWAFAGKSVTLARRFPAQLHMLDYHFKHCIIQAWGSFELQQKLIPESLNDSADDDVAFAIAQLWGVGGDDVFLTPPPSSAIQCNILPTE
jgi:hypothetical protein